MKKIIFAQVLTTNGKTEFSGLYDENGNPVRVERERRDCGISDEEIERTCSMHDDCGNCPLYAYCGEETEECSDE